MYMAIKKDFMIGQHDKKHTWKAHQVRAAAVSSMSTP